MPDGVTVSYPPYPDEQSVDINGWRIPFLTVREADGGKMDITLDERFGFTVSVSEFDEVMMLVAQAIALFSGMPSWPPADLDGEGIMPDLAARDRWMGKVPFLLRPRHIINAKGATRA